ncbi:MAG: CAP domain-containing protein [Chloroflexota bacterium]
MNQEGNRSNLFTGLAIGNLLLLIAVGIIIVVLFNQVRSLRTQLAESQNMQATLVAQMNEPTQTPQPTFTPFPTPTDAPTQVPTSEAEPSPTATATVEPSATPTLPPTATPLPTETPTPTLTPTPSPTPTPAEYVFGSDPLWLEYANNIRFEANLPSLVENVDFSFGAAGHSQYMYLNNTYGHTQDKDNPGYSLSGEAAADNGNIAAAFTPNLSDLFGMDYWVSAPFHLVPILNPRLVEVGHGIFRGPASPYTTFTLDVSTKRSDSYPLVDGIEFPITYPKDGGKLWILRHYLPEWPSPKRTCGAFANYSAPLIVLMGNGDVDPVVSDITLRDGERTIEVCYFTELTYFSSNEFEQSTGREILNKSDAIVIIASETFEIGKRYDVEVIVSGEDPITWSFDAVDRPEEYTNK